MQTFKKAIISTIVFLLCISSISAVCINAFLTHESVFYMDKDYRASIAGTLDFLIIGASRGLRDLNPTVIDSMLGVNSYNLCGSAMLPGGTLAMLKEEIDRNPVETVIIDVGDDDLMTVNKPDYEGNIKVLPRLSDRKTQAKFFLENSKMSEWHYYYSTYALEGLKVLIDLAAGSYVSNVNRANKGFVPNPVNNVFLSENDIYELHNKYTFDIGKGEYYYEWLSIIELCKSHNAEVILVSLPVSDSRIWKYSNFPELYDMYSEIAEEYDCTFLDFNLMKERKSMLSDKDSFYDALHLSSEKATEFTGYFCEILNRISNGEDVSGEFFNSYEDAEKNFEYSKIYYQQISGGDN